MKKMCFFLLCLTYGSLSFGATYEVPTDEALKPFATFELKDFKVHLIGRTLFIRYHLPEMLVGYSERIWLKGKIDSDKGTVVLTGPNAKATCNGVYESMKCQISYEALDIDEAAALTAIKEISKSSLETSSRIQVMRAFSTDPVGIISY